MPESSEQSDQSEQTTPSARTTSSATATVPTSVDGELPDGLMAAFDAYEAALAADDTDALGAAFAPGDTTLRGDAAGLLVGHEAITAFRGRRGGAPARAIESCHVRVITPDSALVVSVNRPRAGGRGLVTQLWHRGADTVWRVEAAQVQAPAPAVDGRIWRVLGSPLIRSTAADGPLAGETIAVKDLFAVEHYAIGAGIPEYLAGAEVQRSTAPALAALIAAGADVRGIAQTDEFAYSIAGRNVHYGTPPNPAVPGALSGGSSSGPASAVALGHASIGLATDTAGSIRVPASYQGLWGIRTTHGAVDRSELLPLAPSFDTVGWLTRSHELLARVATIALEAEEQSTISPAFVIDEALVESAAPEVVTAFRSGVDALVEAGRIEQPVPVALGDVSALYEAFRIVQAAEAWQVHGSWIRKNPGVLGADVAARFDWASTITGSQLAEARGALVDARARLDETLGGRILLLPSASSTAPALDADAAAVDAARTGTLSMTCVAGIGGYPAVSAPLLSVGGAPLGLCLVGPRHSDLSLLGIAGALA